MRFHKKVYIPKEDFKRLQDMTCQLNKLNWQYSKHCLNNLKWRSYNIKDILLYIKNLTLDYKDIFEYYIDNKNIVKICYRVNYINGLDLILVVSNRKEIITIYINTSNDDHITLNKNLYIQK